MTDISSKTLFYCFLLRINAFINNSLVFVVFRDNYLLLDVNSLFVFHEFKHDLHQDFNQQLIAREKKVSKKELIQQKVDKIHYFVIYFFSKKVYPSV